MGEQKVFFVLYANGTWAGAFETLKTAQTVAERNGGQVVRGRWFAQSEVEAAK